MASGVQDVSYCVHASMVPNWWQRGFVNGTMLWRKEKQVSDSILGGRHRRQAKFGSAGLRAIPSVWVDRMVLRSARHWHVCFDSE